MKTFEMNISGNAITMSANKCTIPEIVRVVSGLSTNLGDFYKQELLGKLQEDEFGNLAICHGHIEVSTNPGAATIKMDIGDDGFPCGGDVQRNGESAGHVLKCINYVYHVYAKKLVDIADQLFGDDEEKKSGWIERVLNRNKFN